MFLHMNARTGQQMLETVRAVPAFDGLAVEERPNFG